MSTSLKTISHLIWTKSLFSQSPMACDMAFGQVQFCPSEIILTPWMTHPPLSTEEMSFIQEQWDIEVWAGQFSPLFWPSLLPVMVSMPIFAVLKPSGGLWLVTNHSYGPHSLNLLIPRENISGTPLDGLKQLGDGLKQLGDALLKFRKLHGPVPINLFTLRALAYLFSE